MKSETFKVQIEATEKYFRERAALTIALCGVWFFGIGLLAALIYLVTLGKTLPRRQSEALSYRLEAGTLRADSGVYFLRRKSIPLDRVTDFMLSQGPLERRCGIWSLHVQTAGASGQAIAEAVLYGIENPELVRDQLLRARDSFVAARASA